MASFALAEDLENMAALRTARGIPPWGPGCVKTCTDEKSLESFFLGQLGMSFIGTPLGSQAIAL
jgi:hypothetical protein